MDSKGHGISFGFYQGFHSLHDIGDVSRHGAAVRVTQNETVRPSVNGLFKGGECVLLVFLETVKKVLGIIKQMLYMGPQEFQRVLDNCQVIFKGNP